MQLGIQLVLLKLIYIKNIKIKDILLCEVDIQYNTNHVCYVIIASLFGYLNNITNFNNDILFSSMFIIFMYVDIIYIYVNIRHYLH